MHFVNGTQLRSNSSTLKSELFVKLFHIQHTIQRQAITRQILPCAHHLGGKRRGTHLADTFIIPSSVLRILTTLSLEMPMDVD